MFKQLNGYKDKDFYKEHLEIILYLRNQKYSYDVVAVWQLITFMTQDLL